MLWTLAKVCNPALEHFVEIQVLSLDWAIIMWTSKEFCEVFSKNEYFTLSAIEVPVRRRGSRRSRKQTKVWCRKVISKFSRLQELWKPSSVTVKNCNSFEESSWTFIWFIQSSNFFGKFKLFNVCSSKLQNKICRNPIYLRGLTTTSH